MARTTRAFITRTGTFLPGEPVSNEHIQSYLGRLWGEDRVKRTILALNGIKSRYYALDKRQKPSHDVYQMAALSARACLENFASEDVSYLAAGTTNSPLVGPGVATRLHDHLARAGVLARKVEICSHSGICSSGAQAIVSAERAVRSGEHRSALAIGVEQPSAILKSKKIRPRYDLLTMYRNLNQSRWFMSVFLRFMLSDGAGAFLLQDRPKGLSLAIDWTFSRSFAHRAPLCMKLESPSLLLSQDVTVLKEHLMPCTREVVAAAFEQQNDSLSNFKVVLPHISSYFFKRDLMKVMSEFSETKVPHWTNLKTRGNTGAASIYIMLDEYLRTHAVETGDRILLFIPESGQFNFVLVALTVVKE